MLMSPEPPSPPVNRWEASRRYAGELQQRTAQAFEQSTTRAGSFLDGIKRNKPLAFATQFLPTGWLAHAINGVDVTKSQALADRLRRWYPKATSRQLAERMMLQKSVQSGSLGFVSSLVPGFLAPLLLVDLAASAVLMAELVFQIAAAYNQPLDDPKRKGEVLAIFGIALGGQTAVRAGLTALRAVPIAGAAIGAGTNAALIVALGHAACTFYETGGKALNSEAEVQQAMAEQAAWQASVVEQEDISDLVLVHWHYLMGESRPLPEFLTELATYEPLNPTVLAQLEGIDPLALDTKALIDRLSSLYAATLLGQLDLRIAGLERIPPAAAVVINQLSVRSSLSAEEIQLLESEALSTE